MQAMMAGGGRTLTLSIFRKTICSSVVKVAPHHCYVHCPPASGTMSDPCSTDG